MTLKKATSRLRVEAERMTVLPEKDQEAVQSTMQKSVLESAKFPEITGNLTLHGKTGSITVDVHDEAGAYVGETNIRQTQFGIQPVRAAGGAVKVKDELKIDFVIVASK